MKFWISLIAAIALSTQVSFAAVAVDASIPADIPLGDAADNVETSRAVRMIINKAASAFAHAKEANLDASVTTVYKTKTKQRIDKGKVSFWYKAPDKLHAEMKVESNGKSVLSLFNADGTSVTMLHGNEYLQYPQTMQLAAFTANRRDGDIWNDYSGAFSNGDGASLLVTDDPVEWIDASVLQYIYEGVEDVNGHPCWRLKFVQENDATVTIFIDQKTGVILRDSTAVAYDEDGNRIESFEQAATGSISVYTTDKLTTSGVKYPRDIFKLKLPPHAQSVNKKADGEAPESKEGLWTRLLRAAEKSNSGGTSISAVRQSGSVEVTASTFGTFDRRINSISLAPDGITTKPAILTLLEDGDVYELNSEGPKKLFEVPKDTLYLKPLNAITTTTILSVNEKTDTLTARDGMGKALWTYYHPQNTFYDVSSYSLGGVETIRIIMDDQGGLRLLSDSGKVLHASMDKSSINMAQPDPQNPDQIIYGSSSSTGLFDSHLRRTKDIPLDGWLVSAAWNHGDSTHPVVAISMNSDYDATLESVGLDGSVGWRQVLQLKVPKTFLPYLSPCRVRIDGQPRNAFAAFLSTGFLSIISPDGTILYRGHLTPETIMSQRTNIKFIGFVAADLDGDGITEFYTTSDTNVVKISLH